MLTEKKTIMVNTLQDQPAVKLIILLRSAKQACV